MGSRVAPLPRRWIMSPVQDATFPPGPLGAGGQEGEVPVVREPRKKPIVSRPGRERRQWTRPDIMCSFLSPAVPE